MAGLPFRCPAGYRPSDKAAKILENYDRETVTRFGDEWSRFTQEKLDLSERSRSFSEYFSIFPWERLPRGASGADIGCGSGRWAAEVAPRVGQLHCVDASREALQVARRNLSEFQNCSFYHASVDRLPFGKGTLDFAYSLGVLHHIPDTDAALRDCAATLKPGAPFLVYLYYNLETRPRWYRLLWRLTDRIRLVVSKTSPRIRFLITDVLAFFLYFPLARLSLILERVGLNVGSMPLSSYRRRSFYSMRTDALDRFGTALEKRFSRRQVEAMMEAAGLEKIRFCEDGPFWCAVGFRSPTSKQVR